jgi:hypothetical protein
MENAITKIADYFMAAESTKCRAADAQRTGRKTAASEPSNEKGQLKATTMHCDSSLA